MPKSGQSNRRAACPCRLKLDWEPSARFRGRMFRIVIFLILLLMASAYALWKGGGPARVMATRSEERQVGKGCVSTCRSRGSPEHKKKNETEKGSEQRRDKNV